MLFVGALGSSACHHSHPASDARPAEDVPDGGAELSHPAPDARPAEDVPDGGAELPAQFPEDEALSLPDAGLDSGGTPVQGTVLAMAWGRGAPGRTVVVAGQRTVTDSRGGFSFEYVPPTYDAMVAEPDGMQISVYYGLTRRDPILSHISTYTTALDEPPHTATVSGTLSGDFPFPVDSYHLAAIYYFADRGAVTWHLGQPFRSAGPDYGPVQVKWVGDSKVAGTLAALGQIGTEERHWTNAYLASASLPLAEGDLVTQDLVLSAVPTGRIAGTIQMYQGNGVEAVLLSYHIPGKSGRISLDQCATTGRFDCELPDLSALGGDYCASIVDVFGYAQATRCGGAIGMTDFSIQVVAPPQFKSPVTGTPTSKGSRLTWGGVQNAVFLLEIGPDFPTPNAPIVRAYTSATQLRWPDLQAMGIAFLGGSTYTCQVSALLPYASIDDLASSHGPAAMGVDRQQLDSNTIELPLVN